MPYPPPLDPVEERIQSPQVRPKLERCCREMTSLDTRLAVLLMRPAGVTNAKWSHRASRPGAPFYAVTLHKYCA